MDWAGQIIERITKMPLNEYFQTHIFHPLGLDNITMFPTKQMKDRLVHMHSRAPDDGKLQLCDHPMRRPLQAESQDDVSRIFNSAGGGLFATATDYCRTYLPLLPTIQHFPTPTPTNKP